MKRGWHQPLAAALLLLGAFPASFALGYERTTVRTPDGRDLPIAWRQMPVHYWIDTRGSDDIAGVSALDAVRTALHAWEAPCSSARFVEAGAEDGLSASASDGRNVITWIESGWCTGQICRGSAIALTTLTTSETGTILDADIELNGEAFRFSAGATPQVDLVDVQSVILHEAGHVLGLGHLPSGPSVMVPGRSRGADALRTLSDDDRSFTCEVYPLVPRPTGGGGGGGCAAMPGTPGSAGTLLFLVFILAVGTVARRSR